MRDWLICIGLVAFNLQIPAQSIQRIEPIHWWVGMPAPLQVLVYGDEIADWQVSVDYPGVRLTRTTRVENTNYLFLELSIADSTPIGAMDLVFSRGNKSFSQPYNLFTRSSDPNRIQGLDGSDVIYLLYPDRFANGDFDNDRIPNLQDQSLDRQVLSARHGGDLQGILDHLDYFDSLGVSALWLNPVFTNDEARDSYHGYAATDLYTIDPRLGTNELYRALGDSLQQREKAIVMDLVHNHLGSQHWMALDPPKSNWFHQWPAYTHSNFRAPTQHDPYALPQDKQHFTAGWFAPSMPDLNQDEPLLTKYLIQQGLWWVEYAGVDAFRLDTYAFSDNDFLEQWTGAMKAAYPNLFLFGETFVFNKATQVYNHGQTKVDKSFASHLDGVTDFQWHFAVTSGLQEPFGWTTGWSRLYNTLTQDYLLQQSVNNVIFLDNHDTDRIASQLSHQSPLLQQAIVLLLTQRGIPCLYYGTEWGFTGTTDPDGKVRQDFPGGWPADTLDYFSPQTWPTSDTALFRQIQTLLQFRAKHPWIGLGEMRQFVPEDGIYTYFRQSKEGCVMVLLNSQDQTVEVETESMSPILGMYTRGVDVMHKRPISLAATIRIAGHGVRVLHFTP